MKKFINYNILLLLLCFLSCGDNLNEDDLIENSPPPLGMSPMEFKDVSADGAELVTVAENYSFSKIAVLSVFTLFDTDIDPKNSDKYKRLFFVEPTPSRLAVDQRHKYEKCTLHHENESTYSTDYATIINSTENDRQFKIIISPNETNETRLFLVLLKPQSEGSWGCTIFICQHGKSV